MATEGNNVAAAIFWMKARAGWRDKQEIELSTRTVAQASDVELQRIIARSGIGVDVEGDRVPADGASDG